MPQIENRRIPVRTLLILLVCLLAFLAILIRLFILQVVKHDYYQQKVEDNILQSTPLIAKRGTIYDKNGNAIALNSTTWRVFISPKDIQNTEQGELIANGLSGLLGVPYDTVYRKTLLSHRQDETIQRGIDAETKEKVLAFINEHQLARQVYLEATAARYYPYHNLASHAIGFTGTDGGLLGLEYKYNAVLTGTPGQYIYAKNAMGQSLPFKFSSYTEATDGNNLVTTLDMTLQALLEKQLRATYRDSKAQNRVTGIVMDVNTGAVLAMATYPNFDLNDPYTLDPDSLAKLSAYTGNDTAYRSTLLYEMWNNKTISSTYEPGSTFKILTCAMALEENVVSMTEHFNCRGALTVGGHTIHCHKRAGHGSLTFAQGLQQSCNPVLMTLASRLGSNTFYSYYKRLGYTRKTGIDLPSEAGSIYHAQENFNTVELAVYSFGQTFKITPLQHLSAICTVANGGYAVTPHIVEKITDQKGNIISSFQQNRSQILSTKTCETLAQILQEGVSGNGGAKNAYVPGYLVAAKTGTSEVRDKFDANGMASFRIGSCVAFAPADRPEIAVLMIVDEPMVQNKYGSVVAAPYVGAFLDEALPYLGYARHYTEKEAEKLDVTMGAYVGTSVKEAMQGLQKQGVSYTVIGDGDTVIRQIPESGSKFSKATGKILLYTTKEATPELVTVPDVIGKSAAEANAILTNAGLNLRIIGAKNYDVGNGATVIAQTQIKELVPVGTVITLTFRYLDGDDDISG